MAFIFCRTGIEPSNARLRWSLAQSRLDGIDTLMYRISTLRSYILYSMGVVFLLAEKREDDSNNKMQQSGGLLFTYGFDVSDSLMY